ncbi:hypothetical protein OF83DRAFT_1071497 [Amylostereum chailletii]|nr:hypothetical protein OF83DRAFT_1071497 [Amylostereum chailletii]
MFLPTFRRLPELPDPSLHIAFDGAPTKTPSLSPSERSDVSSTQPHTPEQQYHHPPPIPEHPKPQLPPRQNPPAPSALRLRDLARHRTFSTYRPAQSRVSLSHILQTPRALSRFLDFVPWADFRSLSKSSKECRNLLRSPELKHIVLCRFIPGYRYCLDNADMDNYRDVQFGFRDLDLFMASQRLPLHKYPMHALKALSALVPTLQHDRKSDEYATLCQAHSRAVLLLQSLIHSSSIPVAEESEDLRWGLRSGSQATAVRELVFPAPLSYCGANSQQDRDESRHPTQKKPRSLFATTSGRSRASRTSVSEDGTLPPRRSSRLSLFGSKRRVPPPPPSDDPLGLRVYADSWRGWRRALAASSSASDDEALFRRPHRRFASATPSSRSSLDDASAGDSRSPSRIPENAALPPLASPSAPPDAGGPHDIRLATSRLRAPVLRTFCPCTDLDEHAIAACEAQLDAAGLWEHLSTGDLVCNLGYLPPEERGSSSSSSSTDVSSDPNASGANVWLLFDGAALVPHAPAAVLPLADPLSLPSPLYYVHITPPTVNPRLTLVLPPAADPRLVLENLPTQVRSPHSPRGVARTRRYAWLAHVRARRRPALGEGWQGAWVLEGEGTKEGRQALLDALGGHAGAEREWELVADKTTGSRLWLRYVVRGFGGGRALLPSLPPSLPRSLPPSTDSPFFSSSDWSRERVWRAVEVLIARARPGIQDRLEPARACVRDKCIVCMYVRTRWHRLSPFSNLASSGTDSHRPFFFLY